MRLNRFIREQEVWTENEIAFRGQLLAAKALKIWPALVVDPKAVKEANLKDRIVEFKNYQIDDLEMDLQARALFDMVRSQITSLGDDVVELSSAKTIIYRVYDFFLEVIPRKQRLTLVFNLDFDDCSSLPEKAKDATESAWITNATEKGGVLFSVDAEEDIPAAVALAHEAYEAVSA